MNRTFSAIVRVLSSAVLLALVWRAVDGEPLLAQLRSLDPLLVLAAVAATVPMQVVSALRWQFTCSRIGLQLPLRTALAEYWLAALLNTVLPGGVGGDAARVWRHGRHNGPGIGDGNNTGSSRWRGPLHAVLIERFAGQCVLFAVLAIGIALNHERLRDIPAATWIATWMASRVDVSTLSAVALTLALTLAIAVGAVMWMRRGALSVYLQNLLADAQLALWPWRVALWQIALSLLVVLSYLLIFWLAARAVHSELDVPTTLLAVPVVLTAMTLPISVGGLGVREATAVLVWPALSLPASEGAAAALVYGLVILLGALPGVAVLLRPQCAVRIGVRVGDGARKSASNKTSAPI